MFHDFLGKNPRHIERYFCDIKNDGHLDNWVAVFLNSIS